MAPHSSTLAWKIPWTKEPGGLQSMGSRKVGHLLSDFTFTFRFHVLEKEMATHSSVLAWRIPGMAEPGGLPSVGSHRVGHDWSDLAAADWSGAGKPVRITVAVILGRNYGDLGQSGCNGAGLKSNWNLGIFWRQSWQYLLAGQIRGMKERIGVKDNLV